MNDHKRIAVPDPKATYLPTLYGKARDFHSEHSILNDRWAAEAVEKLDFDFSKLAVAKGDANITLPFRAKQLDGWVQEFLDANPNAVVLNLGCGLDSRVFRLDPPATVSWYDVDLPDVVDFRRQLYPKRHDYQLIAASATDPEWLKGIPKDRPVMAVCEGLIQYLTEEEAIGFFGRIIAAFPRGQFVFDAYGKATLGFLRIVLKASKSGAVLPKWKDAVDDLPNKVPGLRLESTISFLTMPEMVPLLIHSKVQGWVYYAFLDKAEWYRNSMKHYRFEF